MELLYVLIGIVIGVIITLICISHTSAGDLRIDQSDPTESPYLFLELDKPIEFIMNKKYVLFKTNKKNFISRG